MMEKTIREEWDDNKMRLLDAAGIDHSKIPRYFPMEQEEKESFPSFVGYGAIAGGLTGLAVGGAAVLSNAERFKHRPVLYGGFGAVAGSIKNAIEYKKGDNHERNKAKKIISPKKNKRKRD